MTTKYISPDSKRVLVTYEDNTTRETTISELKDKFKDETKDWKDYFFRQLATTFEIETRFAKYQILLD